MPGNQPPDAAQQPDDGEARLVDWTVVYDEHSPRIRRIIERRAGTAVADDLLQETFERALRGQRRFDGGRPIAPWLNTIAFHLTSDLRRQRLTAGEVLVDEDPEVLGPDLAEEAYAASLRRMGIREAFASLNHRHRRVLQLVAIEGMTNEEVAEFEHMTTEAVKSVLARARVNFRASYSAFVERMGMLAGIGGLGPVVIRLRARLQRFADLAANHAGAITVAAVTTAVMGLATLPATRVAQTRASEDPVYAQTHMEPSRSPIGTAVSSAEVSNAVSSVAAATSSEGSETAQVPARSTTFTGQARAQTDGATGWAAVQTTVDREGRETRAYAGMTIHDCDAGMTTTASCTAIDLLASSGVAPTD